MFTGLVETTGILCKSGNRNRLSLAAPAIADGVAQGDSVAVNGCCLTATTIEDDTLHFDLLDETLARTNLGSLPPGAAVNLERALAANARLGGHFVQGHVDCTSALLDVRESGADRMLTFDLPEEFSRYVVSKGSVAINGVSLTVASLAPDAFTVCIIPHTLAHTNLGALATGDIVNLEFDILAKYIEALVGRTVAP